MGKVIESYKEADFGHGLAGMFQESAGCIQAVLRDKPGECCPFAAFEVGTEGGTVHLYGGGDVV